MKTKTKVLSAALLAAALGLGGMRYAGHDRGERFAAADSEVREKAFSLVRATFAAGKSGDAATFRGGWAQLPRGAEAERIERLLGPERGTDSELRECLHSSRGVYSVAAWSENAGLFEIRLVKNGGRFKIQDITEL